MRFTRLEELIERLEYFYKYPDQSQQDGTGSISGGRYRSLRPVSNLGTNSSGQEYNILIVDYYASNETHGFAWGFHFDDA
jgi:hypothetical protein